MGYMINDTESFEPEQSNNNLVTSFKTEWGEEESGNSWQLVPPIVSQARIPVVRPPLHLVSNDAQQGAPVPPPVPQHENTPLFRLSFVGPDQQWYSVSTTVRPGPTHTPQLPRPHPAQGGLPHGYAQPLPGPPGLHPSWQQERATGWSPASASPSVQRPATTWQEEQRLVRPPAADASAQDTGESNKDFLLQIVQPGLAGLMDGSVSTLAPIFAVAFATHRPFTVFLVGLASALGAGISMTFAEALSDDGEVTGRGKPFLRGGVTGLMTFLSGVGHALPFLVPNFQVALASAYVVVAVELFAIAAIRHKYFHTKWWLSIVQVVGGGLLVFLAALLLGNA